MMHLIDYGADQIQRSDVNEVHEVPPLFGADKVRWLALSAAPSEAWLRKAVAEWGFHPHVATDLLDTEARANLEEYPEQIYVDVHALRSEKLDSVAFVQVGLVVHAQGVVSLGDFSLFEGVEDRLSTGRGLIRTKGSDYLFLRLIESVLRPYEAYFDHLESALDALETEVVHRPSQRIVVKILKVKRQLSALRRHVTPLRDVLSSLEASTHPLIKRENRPYVRDVRGKVQAIYERLDAQRSLLESLESLYLSSVGQRTNDVMRILTVFSAVFMPLTFVVGVYGMNFTWMPELEWPWAYPAVWGLMLLIAGSMVLWMRQKKFW
ncbi:MAG: magnesium transport protein CorA [Bacteroidota bacterium]|jgi:magnesium transporter